MLAVCVLSTVFLAPPLPAGDHQRTLFVEGRLRNYLVHIPESYAASNPTSVILALHGAGVNAAATIPMTGLNKKSDQAGFIVVYPDGTGFGPFLTWNAGGVLGKQGEGLPDDVLFFSKVLDDLATRVNVDSKRVYATGLSNGGMMCYRLAAELSDRIAAIAPVAASQTKDFPLPERAVSVMHFHGTDDNVVPPGGPSAGTPPFLTFKSVEATLQIWTTHNSCPAIPEIVDLIHLRPDDSTRVQRWTYAPGREGSEVIYYRIQGGGHTWPGQNSILSLIGAVTYDIHANDLMWEFFQRHPLP